jgi:DNA helicase IV
MRDVLGTIQADQDAIIRAGSRGALVVDGGPGTGVEERIRPIRR